MLVLPGEQGRERAVVISSALHPGKLAASLSSAIFINHPPPPELVFSWVPSSLLHGRLWLYRLYLSRDKAGERSGGRGGRE